MNTTITTINTIITINTINAIYNRSTLMSRPPYASNTLKSSMAKVENSYAIERLEHRT